jgi:hypothetical protein
VNDADSTEQEPAAVSTAADELYAAEPNEFVTTRDRLARAARDAGNADDARRIEKLRKATVPAWIVNRYVLANPEIVHRLRDLHDRLQAAHVDLDPGELRELTTERREAVDEMTRAALDAAGHADAATGLREDVSATFDAAVADPQVAGRLGRLQRAEHWSGFGVAAGDLPTGSPALRLLRGGRAESERRPRGVKEPVAEPATPAPAVDRKQVRDRQRAVRSAQQAFAKADTELEDARSAEQAARELVRELSAQLTDVQRRLTEAKAAVDEHRRAVKAAHGRQREARSALSRAERRAAE